MSDDFVLTTCPFCGCGCSFYLTVVNGWAVSVESCFTDRVSHGKLCIKGRHAQEFIHSPERLQTPLIRRNGELAEASWDEALDFVGQGLNRIKQTFSADAIGLLSSAKCTNEENYLMMRLARAVIGTNNVDHCARLCHASTVAGLAAAFGSGAMTNSIPEVADAECILITGSNTVEQHPLIGSRVLTAKERGATLIVVDPRETPLSAQADLFLRHTARYRRDLDQRVHERHPQRRAAGRGLHRGENRGVCRSAPGRSRPTTRRESKGSRASLPLSSSRRRGPMPAPTPP